MKRWSCVRVVWDDANGGDLGWQHHSTLNHTPTRITSTGMLYRQNRKGITLVLSRYKSSVGASIFIPRSNIVSVDKLKEPT